MRSKADRYKEAAVATDSSFCSEKGKDMLLKGGNAMDAAIASLFCVGVVNIHSTGIGGGGFLVYYDRKQKKAFTYDSRETAPGKATEDMYLKDLKAARIGELFKCPLNAYYECRKHLKKNYLNKNKLYKQFRYFRKIVPESQYSVPLKWEVNHKRGMINYLQLSFEIEQDILQY